MTVSKFQGVVPIPMFDSGQTFNFSNYGTNYSSWDFEAQSTEPMLTNTIRQTTAGQLTQYSAEIMGVFGLSSMEINATAGGAGSATGTYIDGSNYFWGLPEQFNQPPYYLELTSYISPPQGQAEGLYNNAPFSWIPNSTNNLQAMDNPSPMLSNAEKVIGAVTNVAGQPTFQLMLLNKASGLALAGNILVPGNYTDARALYARLQPNRSDGQEVCRYMNAVSSTINNNRRALFSPVNLSSALYDLINLDNAALDTAWQGLTDPSMKAYWNGFVAAMITNGTGPTGGRFETIVMSNDMLRYWVIQFIPQDAYTANQLGRAAGLPQVKIDTNGIFWLNSGDAPDLSRVSYSFSSGFNFPILYFGNLQPISLPCYVGTLPGVLYPNEFLQG